MARTWSAQQETIFEWFSNPSPLTATVADRLYEAGRPERKRRHAIVRARAGCGKTTVIIEGVKRAPERAILICAFSKTIQLELQARINVDDEGLPTTAYGHITAKTLHAIGLACVSRFRERIRVDYSSDRADNLARTVCGKQAPDAIVRLVSKLHTKGRLMAPHATKLGDLTNIAITFECEPSEDWANAGYPLEYVEQRALEAMELASQVKSGDAIDGSDMIFLPVRNGWMTPQYDLVVVDEAQDMTCAQLEIAQGVLKPGGRICVVGDDRQAIFGFIGADSESLDRLKHELGAVELGLTTTYRCGRAIVERAAAIVPDFEAGPNNPEGEIAYLNTSQLVATAGPGDFVLSRINAPLVSHAMQLLRAGKRCRVAGKDIGKGLTGLVRRMKGRSVPDLLGKISAWDAREAARIQAQIAKASNGRKATLQAKLDGIHDQADMLANICDGARNVAEVEARIEALFTDDGLGAAGTITCSSVHKAKGLEAERVFILRDTLRSNTIEEQNITYVAITRAKKSLIWVADDIRTS